MRQLAEGGGYPVSRWAIGCVLLFMLALSACGGQPPPFSDLPAGDAERGAMLFRTSIEEMPTCNGCHSVQETMINGPALKGLGKVAGERVGGLSAGDYLYQSISQPAAYLVSGYANTMYNAYGGRLTAQQIADLIAYLLTL